MQANLMLLLAAAIWGLGFVAQRLGMEHLGPYSFNGLRFLIGALSLLPLIWWYQRQGKLQQVRLETVVLGRCTCWSFTFYCRITATGWAFIYDCCQCRFYYRALYSAGAAVGDFPEA